MIRLILSIGLLTIGLYAQAFVKSSVCKGCHPIIYAEYYESAHRKASVYEDELHKAVWDKHPDKQKKQYTCAQCHTPTDIKLLKALENNKEAMPEKNELQTQEAVSCVYCHKIQDIKEHTKSNKNSISLQEKLFFSADDKHRAVNNKKYTSEKSLFGMVKTKTGSPFHRIDYSNEAFYNGKMCMGCHSHLKNDNNLDLCRVEKEGAQDEETNCISCHMPKVKGSATSIKQTKKHTYHGFASTSKNNAMLAKYVKIKFKKSNNAFNISIKNEASHNLFLHPMRLAKLEVRVLRGDEPKFTKIEYFSRVLGKDGKPTLPWLANKVIHNSMIKANEKRVIDYDFTLKTNDTIEVVFGYYRVNPKMLDTFKLDAKKYGVFHIMKKEYFVIK